MTAPAPLKRLRDLPGVMTLERRAQLDPTIAAESARSRVDEIDEVSLLNFGIDADEAMDRLWDMVSSDQPLVFNPYTVTSEHDTAARFRALGWDVTDEHGRPLLVLKHFDAQLALVVNGALELQAHKDPATWGASLETEAAMFKRQKR